MQSRDNHSPVNTSNHFLDQLTARNRKIHGAYLEDKKQRLVQLNECHSQIMNILNELPRFDLILEDRLDKSHLKELKTYLENIQEEILERIEMIATLLRSVDIKPNASQPSLESFNALLKFVNGRSADALDEIRAAIKDFIEAFPILKNTLFAEEIALLNEEISQSELELGIQHSHKTSSAENDKGKEKVVEESEEVEEEKLNLGNLRVLQILSQSSALLGSDRQIIDETGEADREIKLPIEILFYLTQFLPLKEMITFANSNRIIRALLNNQFKNIYRDMFADYHAVNILYNQLDTRLIAMQQQGTIDDHTEIASLELKLAEFWSKQFMSRFSNLPLNTKKLLCYIYGNDLESIKLLLEQEWEAFCESRKFSNSISYSPPQLSLSFDHVRENIHQLIVFRYAQMKKSSAMLAEFYHFLQKVLPYTFNEPWLPLILCDQPLDSELYTKRSQFGYKPIYYACLGDLPIFYKLIAEEDIEKKSRIDVMFDKYYSILVEQSNIEKITFLLERLSIECQKEILNQALQKNNLEIILLALKYGVMSVSKMYARDERKFFLHGIFEKGNLEIIKLLITADENFNIINSPDFVAFVISVGKLELLELLNEYGVDVLQSSDGNTGLHHAAEHGHSSLVMFYLSRGIDPNATNDNGLTPLHLAAMKDQAFTTQDHYKAAEVLLNAGADVQGGAEHNTPLYFAILHYNWRMAALLFTQHASLNEEQAVSLKLREHHPFVSNWEGASHLRLQLRTALAATDKDFLLLSLLRNNWTPSQVQPQLTCALAYEWVRFIQHDYMLTQSRMNQLSLGLFKLDKVPPFITGLRQILQMEEFSQIDWKSNTNERTALRLLRELNAKACSFKDESKIPPTRSIEATQNMLKRCSNLKPEQLLPHLRELVSFILSRENISAIEKDNYKANCHPIVLLYIKDIQSMADKIDAERANRSFFGKK